MENRVDKTYKNYWKVDNRFGSPGKFRREEKG